MEQCRVKNLYSLSETIAAELLERAEYPWEALQGIREFILKIGPMLDPAVWKRNHRKRFGCGKFHGTQKRHSF